MEIEWELADMNAEETAKASLHMVKAILRHRYCRGWRFLTLWEGFAMEEATWEHVSAFLFLRHI